MNVTLSWEGYPIFPGDNTWKIWEDPDKILEVPGQIFTDQGRSSPIYPHIMPDHPRTLR